MRVVETVDGHYLDKWRGGDGHGQSQYRPDIDGLRALAVALVIIFHLVPRLLPNDFVGVDIFFVISGYVVTLSVLRRPPASLLTSVFSFWALQGIEWVVSGVIAAVAPVNIGVSGLGAVLEFGMMRNGEIKHGTAAAVGWVFVRGSSSARDRTRRIR